MQEQRLLIFEPFCLDVGNERLWRVQEAIHLTHKAFAVLHYLVAQAGQLVTKDEFLEVVWSQTYVGEAALAVCIREIRQALGDNPRTPRFIETVHGRGYWFIAAVTVADRLPASPPSLVPASPPLLVGERPDDLLAIRIDNPKFLHPLVEAKVVPIIEQGIDGPDQVVGFESVEEWAEITDETGTVVGYATPCPEGD